MGKQENCSCLPPHDEDDFFWGKKVLFLAKKSTYFLAKKIKGGVHVDVQRVQTVVTKIESESFCVH